MSISVEVGHINYCQPSRKTRCIAAADIGIVVQIPNGCRSAGGIKKEVISKTIAVEISSWGRAAEFKCANVRNSRTAISALVMGWRSRITAVDSRAAGLKSMS